MRMKIKESLQDNIFILFMVAITFIFILSGLYFTEKQKENNLKIIENSYKLAIEKGDKESAKIFAEKLSKM